MMHALSVLLSDEYMEELKDQPTRTPGPDKNELAYMLMLNALTQQGSTTSGTYRYQVFYGHVFSLVLFLGSPHL